MDFTKALLNTLKYDNLGCKLLVKFESISSVYQAS